MSGAASAPERGQIAARLGRNVYVLEADGSARRRLAAPAGAVDLTWSPDGRRLAFSKGRRGVAFDLYVARRDGRQARLLVRNAEAPSWSPDGTRLVFMRFVCPSGFCPRLENPYELFTVTVEGRTVRRLTSNRGYDGEPDWSPDGTTIAFVGDDGLFLMSAEGGDRRRLTRAVGSNPDWSPDGGRIAFDTFKDVYVLDVARRRARRLTRNAGPDFAPQWSPGGGRIAYLSNPFCARRGGCIAHEPWLIRTTGAEGGLPTSITGLGWGPPSWVPPVTRG